jgi:hypothetical protein
MHKMISAAAFAVILSAQAVRAEQVQVDLLPSDPKYNTPACVSMRAKAQNYTDGVLQQSAGSYVIAAVMPGGTVGFMATQMRKREMFKYQVEQACLSKPPKRPYLEPSATLSKD